MTSTSDLDLVTAAAELAVQRVLAQLNQLTVSTRPGTIVDLGIGSTDGDVTIMHDVIIDGDEGEAIPVTDLTTGASLRIGDRVMVLFVPPHGAYIIGSILRRYAGGTVVKRQALTGNSATYTGDTLTDMALTDVSVIAGHFYGVHLHAQYGLSVTTSEWRMECRVNGTQIGFFDWAARSTQNAVDGWAFWTPGTTSDTDDITVFANQVQAGNLTLQAASDAERILTLFDFGVLPE